MKAIINGKRYDTNTATKLAGIESHHYRNDFHWWHEELYKTKNGAYFIDGEGGALSKYSEPVGNNAHTGGGRIFTLTRQEAKEWAEGHGLIQLLETEFGDEIEDA